MLLSHIPSCFALRHTYMLVKVKLGVRVHISDKPRSIWGALEALIKGLMAM